MILAGSLKNRCPQNQWYQGRLKSRRPESGISDTNDTELSETEINKDDDDEDNNKEKFKISDSESKDWEKAVRFKKIELVEKYGEVASGLIKSAEVITEERLYDINHYWDYLYKALENEELKYHKFVLEPQSKSCLK